ncbi:YesL family protein [Salisediminibacterium selenitireducens]|uniref:Uncharacterized protein n=1 Tax=Bacillus selenitireducens (strain ATCC 700615 / DSM 15326 / MLS10) TaxID=439292 RepID=D6XWM0_BACIE|nr:DUF624 domain-containing protein [Salisediminibacterium selenitireducens]ADH97862.1 protein of unknown function DUF624 [[Bacillus] selenitireducens MLS10]
MNKIQQLSEGIFRYALLNLMWVGYSLLGFIVFGILPATIALFKVHFHQHRNRLEPERESDVRVFHEAYKSSFIRGNLLMLILTAAGVFLYADLYIVLRMDHALMPILLGLIVALTVLYLLFLFFVPASFAYENRPFFETIRAGFYMAVLSPIYSISLVIAFGIIIYAGQIVPAIHLFFTASVMTYLVTAVFLLKADRLRRMAGKNN